MKKKVGFKRKIKHISKKIYITDLNQYFTNPHQLLFNDFNQFINLKFHQIYFKQIDFRSPAPAYFYLSIVLQNSTFYRLPQ